LKPYEHDEEGARSTGSRFTAAVVLPMLLICGEAGIPCSAVDEVAADVAFVESVRGQVVALWRTTPVLLHSLDVIRDRTQVDLLPDTELRICHYRMQRILVLTGPARAIVSADGVTPANGSDVDASGTCVAPTRSSSQGGIITRGVDAEP
jgi:hypothetical protein